MKADGIQACKVDGNAVLDIVGSVRGVAAALDGHGPALGLSLGAVEDLDGLGDMLCGQRLEDTCRLDVLYVGGIVACDGGIVLAVGDEVKKRAEAGFGECLTLLGNFMSV